MPFSSKRQMRFMFAAHPAVAKKMAARQEKKSGDNAFKKLPKQAKRRGVRRKK